MPTIRSVISTAHPSEQYTGLAKQSSALLACDAHVFIWQDMVLVYMFHVWSYRYTGIFDLNLKKALLHHL